MRKIVCLVCLLSCLLCSCSSHYHVDGFENFATTHSDYELNVYILPSEDFADRFQNLNINYHYREEYSSMAEFFQASFVVIEYEPIQYKQAKQYCLENMQLSETNTIAYNDYTFIENIKLTTAQGRNGTLNAFPHWFNMFAYNDDLNCLVFIGFYGSNYTANHAQNIADGWEQFLETYFSDSYNWKENAPL